MNGILTYGSLIHPAEIKMINPEASYIPVKLDGYKRYIGKKSKRKSVDSKRGVFTVKQDDDYWCNGLLIYPINEEYFNSFDTREYGYNKNKLDMNKIKPYGNYSLPEELESVYIAIAKEPNQDLKPVPSYVDLCIEGARQHTREFATDFLLTTYYK